jgi:Fe-S cluster biosynthesis and repair protein YggX
MDLTPPHEERKAILFSGPESLGACGARAEGTVFCVKLGRVAPAMTKPPFSGALGQRIFENVSEQGWKLWEAQATILMNHHGLSMADPEARKFLLKQMEEFFFGEGAQLPADWVPPTAGGKGKGGGGKGAPAPRRK